MAEAALTGWVLKMVEGPAEGKYWELYEDRITVGRGINDTIPVHDAAVTRCQLVIEWDRENGCHYLSTPGDSVTFINNIYLERNARVKHQLAEGDQIQIGCTVFRYLRNRWTSGSGASPGKMD